MIQSINGKRKNSQDKIEKVFLNLIQKYEITEISVSKICKLAQINRSTFYSNYIDIYDLVEKIKTKLINDVNKLYEDERKNKCNSHDFLKLMKI